ncbi:peptidase inhibitor 16-like [Diretmus argenteus]
MQLQSLSKLQGASTQRGVSTRRTAQKRASILGTTPRTRPLRWSSRLRRTSGCCLCPARGALLWAWLLLATLVVPGAWSFLTEEQEELIVELHNYYRGMVSPSASAMLPLKWDSNLKVIAEGYSAKCIWNHNPDLEETGENLYASTGSLDLRLALEKWFLEHLDFDYHNNTCPEDKMCGHYTQMVWADTHRVGCAFHICNTMEGLNFERANFLVCNYYPAGNYEEEKPYVEGDWCSRCPDNLQNCQNNLCVAEEEEEEMTVVPPLATSDPILPETSSTTRTPRTTPRPSTQHPALGPVLCFRLMQWTRYKPSAAVYTAASWGL